MILNHKQYGNSGGYIIILHGLFGMLDNWHLVANYLSTNYRVVTVDQRNHGQSFHSDEMSYELMATDLKQLMNFLSIDKAIIMGHSMGGKTAMTFASLYPTSTLKLIIIDIALRGYEHSHQSYFDAYFNIDFSAINSRKEADELFSKWESDQNLRLFLLKNIDRDDSGGFKLKININSIYKAYPEIVGSIHIKNSYKGQTALIKGENSSYISEEDLHSFSELYPNYKLYIITKANHWVHADNFVDFTSKLSLFLVS